MDSNKRILHPGKILAIEQDQIRVSFTTQGACGGCAARSKCGMVDSSQREVVVAAQRGVSYQIGQEVNVSISYQMGVMSVVVAYIIPLIVLIAILAVAVHLGVNEGIAALISLGSVALYFVGVYLLRSRLDKQIKFTIEK